MAVNKSTGSSAIRDRETGDTAEILTRTDGKKALAVDSVVSSVNAEFRLEVALGSVAGVSRESLVGYNASIGVSVETVWRKGGIYVFPTAAETLNIRSTDPDDTLAGTGAKVVLVEGLDANYDEILETVNMNGTTNVVTTNSYLRVNKLTVAAAGSQGTNDGDIVAEQTTSGITINFIAEEDSVSQTALYTIPAGKTGFLYSGLLSIESNRAQITFYQRTSGGVKYKILPLETSDSGFVFEPPIPFPISEKSDIYFQGKINTGNSGVTTTATIVVKDN